MDALIDTVDVCSSDDSEFEPCSLYTDVSMCLSDSEGDDSCLESNEDQHPQDNYIQVERSMRCFQELMEQNALLGVQLELGSPWLVVDTEGEIAASFCWQHRSSKDPITTEEHKSHFALQYVSHLFITTW